MGKVTTSWDDLSRNREKNRAHRHTWQGYQLATRASTPGHPWAKIVVSFFFFFLTNFLFGDNFRFVEKLQRSYREFPYILPTASPNVNIFYNHATFVKMKRCMLVQSY